MPAGESAILWLPAPRDESSGPIQAVESARQRHPAAGRPGRSRVRAPPVDSLEGDRDGRCASSMTIGTGGGFAALDGALGSPCGSSLNETGTP